jgi:hypothetical protein
VKKPRRGRPPLPKGTAKKSLLSVRLTREERRAIDQAADEAGKPASEWARELLLASVRRTSVIGGEQRRPRTTT